MIRVTVELLPLGREKDKELLGVAYITNDGSGSRTKGNYRFTLSKKGNPNSIWKRGAVLGFPRKRLLGWDLVFRALRACVGERNV